MSDESRRCPDEATLVAHVRGEVTGEARASLEAHVADCPACRKVVDETHAVIERLRSASVEAPGRDLADDILARIPEAEWTFGRQTHRLRLAALAAAVLLVLAGGWRLFVDSRARKSDASAEIASALDWLASAQEADGSWDPAKWGGQGDYRVGLSGLALLTFVAEGRPPLDNRYAETVERTLDYLLRQQHATGRFGPFFQGAPYNHGIATVALLEVYARTRDNRLRMPLARAVGFIKARQDDRGGWGYLAPEPRTNTSITAWQVHALLLANSLGWSDRGASAERGLVWLESVVDPEGLAGYSRPGEFPEGPTTLTAMTAFCLSLGRDLADLVPIYRERADERARVVDSLVRLAARSTAEVDYYQWYFLTRALHAAGRIDDVHDAELARTLGRLRKTLIEHQVKSGPNAGSWEPTDRWGSAGGRVYATAMATLALEADARTDGLPAGRRHTP